MVSLERALPGEVFQPPTSDHVGYARGRGFLGADIFLRMCISYRAVWIAGRFGSMKTLLAVAVSDALLNAGLVPAGSVMNSFQREGLWLTVRRFSYWA